jgi:flagellar assembly protein FliH
MILSNFFSSADVQNAQPVSMGALDVPIATGFRARFADGQELSAYIPRSEMQDQDHHSTEAIDPVEQARAEAFAQGFEAGSRITRETMAVDTDAQDRLARALEQLSPAQSGELSTMLSAAVLRLVTQIVGNAPVDEELLRARVEAVAGFIDTERGRHGLYVHPDDLALLDGCELAVQLMPDAKLTRGSVRLDTSEGWIEDGPDVQLSRLKAMFDDMEGKA